jgi:hypothetical protein
VVQPHGLLMRVLSMAMMQPWLEFITSANLQSKQQTWSATEAMHDYLLCGPRRLRDFTK